MDRYAQNDYAEFWMDKGILFFVYKAGVHVTLQAARLIVADRLQFQGEKAFPVFCDVRNIQDSEKTARDYLAREGSAMTKAVGVLVHPPVTRAMLDFYLRTNKPLVPTRVFDNREEALTYLAGFK